MSNYSSSFQLWASTKGARCPARLGLDSFSLNLSITQGQLAVNAMGIGAAILIVASILLARRHLCRIRFFPQLRTLRNILDSNTGDAPDSWMRPACAQPAREPSAVTGGGDLISRLLAVIIMVGKGSFDMAASRGNRAAKPLRGDRSQRNARNP